MKFTGPISKLEMTIVAGPDAEGWCKLRAHIESDAGTFTSPADPCITTYELTRLEAFFSISADSPIQKRKIDFVEPELVLRWSQGVLAVTLSYALCPPWADVDEGFNMSLPADEAAMRRASEYIRKYRHNNAMHTDGNSAALHSRR